MSDDLWRVQPTIVFTLYACPKSQYLLNALVRFARPQSFVPMFFRNDSDALEYFAQDGPPAIALFDTVGRWHNPHLSGAFNYVSRAREIDWVKDGYHEYIPAWAVWHERNQWAVEVIKPRMSSVRQIHHDFFVRFSSQIEADLLPWTSPWHKEQEILPGQEEYWRL